MPRYNLTCAVTVSAYTTVEADSLELAIEEAEQRGMAMRFNGSAAEPDELWCVDEIDGEPLDIAGEENE